MKRDGMTIESPWSQSFIWILALVLHRWRSFGAGGFCWMTGMNRMLMTSFEPRRSLAEILPSWVWDAMLGSSIPGACLPPVPTRPHHPATYKVPGVDENPCLHQSVFEGASELNFVAQPTDLDPRSQVSILKTFDPECTRSILPSIVCLGHNAHHRSSQQYAVQSPCLAFPTPLLLPARTGLLPTSPQRLRL